MISSPSLRARISSMRPAPRPVGSVTALSSSSSRLMRRVAISAPRNARDDVIANPPLGLACRRTCAIDVDLDDATEVDDPIRVDAIWLARARGEPAAEPGDDAPERARQPPGERLRAE